MPYATKKPSLKKFREVVEALKGARGEVAKALNVNRLTVNNWCKADPAFQACFAEYNGKLLDECLKSARLLAVGIPQTKKVNGKNVVTGWKEKPDGQMLRYLIGKLGRDEGFAETLDITSNGETISAPVAQPVVVEIIDRREHVRKSDEEADATQEG
jgi:hypothetical protein